MTRKPQKATNMAILRKLVEEAEHKKGPTFDVPYQGKPRHLRRITVEASLPVYRVQNGRTHKAQIEFLANHPQLPKDFFRDPDDPDVQKAQHQILCTLIKQKELDEDLSDRGQRAPIVLSADGMVLDGNRRLAALRSARVQYVEAVVLPETATAKEMFETEIELQMQKDTKAEYPWIDQALHIEYGINEVGESIQAVAKRMRLEESEVKEQKLMLDYARQYLVWAGHEGMFHKIPSSSDGDSKQIFRDLALRLGNTSIRNKLSEADRRGIRDMCFLAVKQGSGYKEIREVIGQLIQNHAKLKQRLEERVPVRVGGSGQLTLVKLPSKSNKPNPLADLAEAGGSGSPNQLASMSEVAKHEKAGPAALELLGDLATEERERKKGPLQRAQRALDLLSEIEISPRSEELGDLAKTLGQLFTRIEALVAQVEKAKSSKGQ